MKILEKLVLLGNGKSVRKNEGPRLRGIASPLETPALNI
jgi:hypothetical protein